MENHTYLISLKMNRRPGKHKNNIKELVARYERMLTGDTQSFFDTHEFEDIADHYIDKGLLGEAMSSMEIAFEQYPFSTSFLIKKVQILTILERLEEASLTLEIAESLDPINSDLYIAKGSIYSI